MVWPFKKKKTFDDSQKEQFAELLSPLLEMQRIAAVNYSIEDSEGHPNRKALGYIYGFIDAALQTIGQDMSDISIGGPIFYQVLNNLFPGHGQDYTKYFIDHMEDETTTLGVMTGGQQYLKYHKPGSEGIPMGLARFLMQGDSTKV